MTWFRRAQERAQESLGNDEDPEDKPDALLARMFASQRTASAIAGPGPIQTDGFPVLEYEAPVAFFIGMKAQRIARFDERTWQSGFASPERRGALASLDDRALRGVFDRDTINRELWQAVSLRLKRTGRSPGVVDSFPIPCVFDPSAGSAESMLPPDPSEQLKALVTARAELQTGKGSLQKNVESIRNLLAAQLVSTGAKTPEKNSASFAAVALRACILKGNFPLARDMLALGLRFDAADPELLFLARILEREGGGDIKTTGL